MSDRARSLMTAIESELRASATPLEVLARSPSLDRGDLEAFRAEAERALEARNGGWVNFLVSRADSGEVVMNLLVPAGGSLQRPADTATIRESARSRPFTVGEIVLSEVPKRPLFAIRVPVVRRDRVELVLSAVVDPATVGQVVDRQKFPPEWAVAVIDGNFRFVARRPAAGFGNAFASPSLRQAIESPSRRLDPRRAARRQQRLPHRPSFHVQPLGGVDVGADQHRRHQPALPVAALGRLRGRRRPRPVVRLVARQRPVAADPRDRQGGTGARPGPAARPARCRLGGRAAPAGAGARRGGSGDPRARGQAAGGRAGAARRRPRQGRVPGDARPRAAQSARLGVERLASCSRRRRTGPT